MTDDQNAAGANDPSEPKIDPHPPTDGQGKRAMVLVAALSELHFDEPTPESVLDGFAACLGAVTELQDLHPPHFKLPREAQRLWRDLEELVSMMNQETVPAILRAIDVLQDELVQTYKLREYLDAQADRLEIDKKRNMIVFDGTEHPCSDPLAMNILQVIRDHGTPVSAKEVARRLRIKMHEKTVRNHIDRLPDTIQGLIKTGVGTGHWLELPPRE